MKKKKTKKFRLLKDIVIPSGTIFYDASGSVDYGNGMFGAVIGLTKDSFGDFIYEIDKLDKDIEEWFEEVE